MARSTTTMSTSPLRGVGRTVGTFALRVAVASLGFAAGWAFMHTATASAAAPSRVMTMPIPGPPQVSVRALTFSGHGSHAPDLWMYRRDLRALPADVTLLTGVKRHGSHWVGMVTMIRWATDSNGADTGNDLGPWKVKIHSHRRFKAAHTRELTGTAQAPAWMEGGGWTARVGRYSRNGRDKDWGGAAGLLGQVGDLAAGHGNMALLTDATGADGSTNNGPGIVGDTFTINVTLSGNGVGEISDNFNSIDCKIEGGIVSGTCTATYGVGTRVTLYVVQSGSSGVQKWTLDCASSTGTSCTADGVKKDQVFNAGSTFTKP